MGPIPAPSSPREPPKQRFRGISTRSSTVTSTSSSEVELTSIDKVVYLSQYQAQALFTMRVTPATGGPTRGDAQGIAQLLLQRGQILVCSYVLRTGGSY